MTKNPISHFRSIKVLRYLLHFAVDLRALQVIIVLFMLHFLPILGDIFCMKSPKQQEFRSRYR